MKQNDYSSQSYYSRDVKGLTKPFLEQIHLDTTLIGTMLALIIIGLFILYSASNQSMAVIIKQVSRFTMAFIVMFLFAQIPPRKYYQWTPWLFIFGIFLLIAVLGIGHIGKGAQRWLNFGIIKFQPSEFMKLIVPMMLAWYLDSKNLPPNKKDIFICSFMLIVPVLLTAKQPDLGTAIIIASSGIFVLLLSGISWRFIATVALIVVASTPILWHFMHGYQHDRVLTFLNPERDPLGAGYHIIQSKIAIGSGGLFGKGWLNGTQSHLSFLPEHATDFIFAVAGEELGLLGCVTLIILLMTMTVRGLYISTIAQDTFSRLIAGSLSLTFFIQFFVNIGMVTGLLPVVGIPLPLVSYGGTSMVAVMAGFGMIMSVHTHRKLVAN